MPSAANLWDRFGFAADCRLGLVGARPHGGVRTPIRIDVTDPVTIAAAAEAASDVNLLINNAGCATGAALLDGVVALYPSLG